MRPWTGQVMMGTCSLLVASSPSPVAVSLAAMSTPPLMAQHPRIMSPNQQWSPTWRQQPWRRSWALEGQCRPLPYTAGSRQLQGRQRQPHQRRWQGIAAQCTPLARRCPLCSARARRRLLLQVRWRGGTVRLQPKARTQKTPADTSPHRRCTHATAFCTRASSDAGPADGAPSSSPTPMAMSARRLAKPVGRYSGGGLADTVGGGGGGSMMTRNLFGAGATMRRRMRLSPERQMHLSKLAAGLAEQQQPVDRAAAC